MKPPDGFDLDAEILKYGGRISRGMPPLRVTDTGAPAAATPPFDLDAEIGKYGGHTSPQPSAHGSAGDPLAVLRQFDPSCCSQVQVFAKMLGASVDMVVPRGTVDPCMVDGMSWRVWEHRRLARIFRTGCATSAETRVREEKAERSAWLEHWRRLQRGWAKWMRWRQQSPQAADVYRRQHRDAGGGDEKWLLDFTSVRLPRAPSGKKPDQEIGMEE
jgi:hypothetical protein